MSYLIGVDPGVSGAIVVDVTMPFPPSVNRMWRQWRGRTILSREGRAYRVDAVRALAQVETFGAGLVRVHVDAYMPDKRKRDIDNLWKACGDALESSRVLDNDSQIRDLRIVHCGVDRENPRLVVHMEAL